MVCLVCNNLINSKITIFNIFKTNIHKICDNCFKRNTFIQHFSIIPITDYIIEEHTLFQNYVEPQALMNFLRPYYIYYLKYKLKNIILCFDTIEIIIYNTLQQVKLGNIYLLVLSNKRQKEIDHYV